MVDNNAEICFSCPGKVILSGEHSVVYGCKALSLAIDKRTYCMISKQPMPEKQQGGGLILVDYQKLKKSFSIAFFEIKHHFELPPQKESSINQFDDKDHQVIFTAFYHAIKEQTLYAQNIIDLKNQDTNINQVQKIVSQQFADFVHYHEKQRQNIQIKVNSELPLAGSLGSSASFSGSLSASILQYFLDYQESVGLNRPPIDNQQDFKLMVNSIAYQIERLFHGNPSGIDNNTVIQGGCLKFYFTIDPDSKEKTFSIEKLSGASVLNLNDNYSIMLIDTLVPKSTKKAVQDVKDLCENDKIGGIGRSLINAIGDVTENMMALLSAEYNFKQQEFLELIRINQGLLYSLKLSHQKIDKVISLCSRFGLPVKITGAGQGGCCICLIPKTMQQDEVEKFKQELLESKEFELVALSIEEEGLKREKKYQNFC